MLQLEILDVLTQAERRDRQLIDEWLNLKSQFVSSAKLLAPSLTIHFNGSKSSLPRKETVPQCSVPPLH